MKWWNQLKSSNFIIRLTHWEYWPFAVIYAPAFIYWLYLSIKARSPLFFSAANPGIEAGGLAGESKINILRKLPGELIPKTVFVSLGEPSETVQQKLQGAGINLPMIAKPNIGSRGFLVRKLLSFEELWRFLSKQRVDFLLQEFIDYPVEVSILYYRFPNEREGHISSVTLKEYLHVIGDGKSTVLELIKQKDRAKLQLQALVAAQGDLMNRIPGKNEVLELVPFGNHCRGAAFYNGNHLIDRALIQTFDHISHQLDGIYLGRFDIKCEDIDSLRYGEKFKILEINGVGAEPAHIYDPGYSLFQAFRDIRKQWSIIYKLSQFNRRNGIKLMSLKEAYHTFMHIFTYKKFASGRLMDR